jgi:hypothetical protein
VNDIPEIIRVLDGRQDIEEIFTDDHSGAWDMREAIWGSTRRLRAWLSACRKPLRIAFFYDLPDAFMF